MKKLPMAAATLALGLALATPAMAGHRGPFRGQRVVARNHFAFFAPRPRAFFSFGFGVPAYDYYPPAPVYYYPPYPFVAPPPYYSPGWVPGHYAWSGGVRLFIGGHWSHRHRWPEY